MQIAAAAIALMWLAIISGVLILAVMNLRRKLKDGK